MAEFKLVIADPKTGKCVQKEVKDAEAKAFAGLKIKDAVKGEAIGFPGYEFTLTGGSDKSGFPMRSGIMGARKKIKTYPGLGYRKTKEKGMQKRKTVCGSRVTPNIAQISLKITKEGSASLFPKEEAKEVKVEEKKAE